MTPQVLFSAALASGLTNVVAPAGGKMQKAFLLLHNPGGTDLPVVLNLTKSGGGATNMTVTVPAGEMYHFPPFAPSAGFNTGDILKASEATGVVVCWAFGIEN